jgi:peroxiredoxin
MMHARRPAHTGHIALVAILLTSGSAVLASASDKPATETATVGQTTSGQDEAAPRRRDYTNPEDARTGVLPAGIGIAPGSPAPDATVRDAEGREVSLASLSKDGPIMVVFYRGGWCPYCNAQIHDLTRAFPDYQKRGVRPVVISVDQAKESARTQATYSIPFPVLSDPDLAAHRAFRVLHQADTAEFARLKSYGIDLENASGRMHHVIAVPSIFIIDKAGVVRWAHAESDYTKRPSNAQLLAAIDRLGLK